MDAIWYQAFPVDDRNCSVCSLPAYLADFQHNIIRDDSTDDNFIVHEQCDQPEELENDD